VEEIERSCYRPTDACIPHSIKRDDSKRPAHVGNRADQRLHLTKSTVANGAGAWSIYFTGPKIAALPSGTSIFEVGQVEVASGLHSATQRVSVNKASN
jgi:hypothetical protein